MMQLLRHLTSGKPAPNWCWKPRLKVACALPCLDAAVYTYSSRGILCQA